MTTPNTTAPDQHLRRTPLRLALEKAGARWTALEDIAIADGLGTVEGARHLAITDLSPLPRLGFKGRETIAAMQKRGIVLEATPNRAYRQPDGGLCLVLAASEVILLSPLAGDNGRLQGLHDSWRSGRRRAYIPAAAIRQPCLVRRSAEPRPRKCLQKSAASIFGWRNSLTCRLPRRLWQSSPPS